MNKQAARIGAELIGQLRPTGASGGLSGGVEAQPASCQVEGQGGARCFLCLEMCKVNLCRGSCVGLGGQAYL